MLEPMPLFQFQIQIEGIQKTSIGCQCSIMFFFFFLTPLTSHFSISIMGIILLPLRFYKNENARICITTNTGTLHESKKC